MMMHLCRIILERDSDVSEYLVFCADERDQTHVVAQLEEDLVVDDGPPRLLLSRFRDIFQIYDADDLRAIGPIELDLTKTDCVRVLPVTLTEGDRALPEALRLRERALSLCAV